MNGISHLVRRVAGVDDVAVDPQPQSDRVPIVSAVDLVAARAGVDLLGMTGDGGDGVPPSAVDTDAVAKSGGSDRVVAPAPVDEADGGRAAGVDGVVTKAPVGGRSSAWRVDT